VIGCDIVVSANTEALAKMKAGVTRAVVNCHRNADRRIHPQPGLAVPLERNAARPSRRRPEKGGRLHRRQRPGHRADGRRHRRQPVPARLAWQQGWCRSRKASLTRAIELNGVAVEFNLKAFLWGRRAAHDRAAVERFGRAGDAVVALPRTPTLDDLVARRAAYLTDYQDAAYAGRYRALVEQVRAAEARSARRASPRRWRATTSSCWR
jgi:indolepyruvate ferredoxin oxidoreductase